MIVLGMEETETVVCDYRRLITDVRIFSLSSKVLDY
jgi:hypothetical protein